MHPRQEPAGEQTRSDEDQMKPFVSKVPSELRHGGFRTILVLDLGTPQCDHLNAGNSYPRTNPFHSQSYHDNRSKPLSVNMMYYRHSGINYQENSARIDVTRASFTSLPGELRNLAYAATLKWKTPITLAHNPSNGRFITDITRTRGRDPLEALDVLSTLDRNIHREARSYFFGNNVFIIPTSQSFTTSSDYIETYIALLQSIGESGRHSLRFLRLIVSGDCKYHVPTPAKALKLWSLLGECINLSTLDLYVDIDYFYPDQLGQLKFYMSTEGAPVHKPWPGVLDSTLRLRHLQRLTLRPVFSGRWRFFDVSINEQIDRADYDFLLDVRTFRLRARRPVEEAEELVALVKGCVRKALRGSVRVQVIATEVWNEYGPDLLFGRERWTGQWILGHVGVCKPANRKFTYHTGWTPRKHKDSDSDSD